MIDYCSFADVFYGNGEVTEFASQGAASKWFFIKALCGNTTPNALFPFGKMSVGAYSGGYPCGYGTHYPNYCGGIKKTGDKMKVRGFSHLHQSGTGAIGYYYNYAVVTPFYRDIGETDKFRDIHGETARPGYYSLCFDKIKAELSATHSVALHRYTFSEKDGRVSVDFSNDGLLKEFGERFYSQPKEPLVFSQGNDTVFFSGVLSGVRLYFCVRAKGENVRLNLFENNNELSAKELHPAGDSEKYGCVFDFDGNEINLLVSFSTLGFENALREIESVTVSFDKAAENAYAIWNKYLSAIKLDTDDESLREKFYSCFYHSLVKPSVMTGENILGVSGDTVSDLATLWDQYKTLYPLIFTLYKDEGKKITDSLINISRTLGKIPCSFALTEKFPCENQAKMLGIITLCEACYHGLCSADDIAECISRELDREDFREFLTSGYFERYTHILDTTDACLFASDIIKEKTLRERLLTLSENWVKAYGSDALMSEDSPYYEGDRYTYSFRLQANIEERVSLAGGKENYTKLLDDFFGFGKPAVTQVTDIENPGAVIKERACHRFEGFNNECDMETPFSYIFSGRHDRLCEIVNSAVNDSYRLGTNGLPGNNDSGGLSSCFMWLVLGIFPWAGKGKMLLGCPQCEAEISLAGGKTLSIKITRSDISSKTVKEIFFNGRRIQNYMIDTAEFLGGGTLEFIF